MRSRAHRVGRGQKPILFLQDYVIAYTVAGGVRVVVAEQDDEPDSIEDDSRCRLLKPYEGTSRLLGVSIKHGSDRQDMDCDFRKSLSLNCALHKVISTDLHMTCSRKRRSSKFWLLRLRISIAPQGLNSV